VAASLCYNALAGSRGCLTADSTDDDRISDSDAVTLHREKRYQSPSLEEKGWDEVYCDSSLLVIVDEIAVYGANLIPGPSPPESYMHAARTVGDENECQIR
jgi:hypothetical protein